MPSSVLRRTTFSGRLLRNKVDENASESRLILQAFGCMVVDIVLCLGISCALFIMFSGKGIDPYQRPFSCGDESLRNPFKENTVGLKHLLAVSLALPFFIVAIVEGLICRNAKGANRVAKFLSSTTLIYLKYIIVYAGCTFAMEFLKCYFGRLRPHFVSVCDPDWSAVDCSNPENVIAPEDLICLNPSSRRIRTARTSFPSGHTAAAFHVFLFLYIYLNRMASATKMRQVKNVRNIVLPIVAVWTLFTAITRVTDYWHFPTDVLGGFVLAVVFVVPGFYSSWKSSEEIYRSRDLRHCESEENNKKID